jgi:hypothetical protein
MTPAALRQLFGLGELGDRYRHGTVIPPRRGEAEVWADVFARFDSGELLGLVMDASVIAGNLSEAPEVRTLAACVASVADAVAERRREFDVLGRDQTGAFVWASRDVLERTEALVWAGRSVRKIAP